MTHGRANILLLAAGAIWGLGFVAQSSAMDSVEPFMFITLRFLLAVLTVTPLAIREAKAAPKKLSHSDYFGFAVIGLMLFAGAALQQIGMQTTSVTNAGFLTGLCGHGAVPRCPAFLAMATSCRVALRADRTCRHLSPIRGTPGRTDDWRLADRCMRCLLGIADHLHQSHCRK